MVEKTGYEYIYDNTFLTTVVIIVVFILMILGAAFYLSFKKKKAIAYELNKLNEKWHIQFSSANERKDFECIYNNRLTWLVLLTVQSPPISQFFEVLNEHQYKQNWSIDDEVEINNSFDEIRNIFMKKA